LIFDFGQKIFLAVVALSMFHASCWVYCVASQRGFFVPTTHFRPIVARLFVSMLVSSFLRLTSAQSWLGSSFQHLLLGFLVRFSSGFVAACHFRFDGMHHPAVGSSRFALSLFTAFDLLRATVFCSFYGFPVIFHFIISLCLTSYHPVVSVCGFFLVRFV